MFWTKYPYINLTDLNLDYILRILKMQSEAKNIDYDDDNTGLNADNVQSAIEALHTLITNASAYIRVDDIIPAIDWLNGKTFTHVQTVNNATLSTIISAVKNENLVVLAAPNGEDKSYYNLVAVDEDSLNLTHTLYFWSDIDNMMRSLVINGLNDPVNVYIELLPAVTIKVEASNVNYDNSGSGMSADNVQSAIDELKGDIPTTASEIGYDNTGSGMTATDVQSAIDELKGDIPTTASEIGYDNTGSGMTATDVQGAIDELKGGTDTIGTALSTLENDIDKALLFTGVHNFTFTYDGVKTCKDAVEDLYAQLRSYISSKNSNYRFQIQRIRPAAGLPETYQLSKEFYTNTFAGNISCAAVNADWGSIESVAFSSNAKCTNIVMSTSAYTDFSNNVEANGNVAHLYINEYMLYTA